MSSTCKKSSVWMNDYMSGIITFDEIENFWNVFNDKIEVERAVWESSAINYYGIAGVGKTTLTKSLCMELEERNNNQGEKIPYVYLDVSNYDDEISIFNLISGFLYKKFNFHFTEYFEAAKEYSNYNCSKNDISFDKNNNMLSAGKNLLSQTDIGGYVLGITDFAIAFYEKLKYSSAESKKQLFYSSNPKEYLSNIFSNELKKNLSNFLFPCIIILDGIDSFRLSSTGNDFIDFEIQWLKNIISEQPEVIWILTSREKIEFYNYQNWKNVFKYIELKELSLDKTKEYLYAHKICVDDKQATYIHNVTGGLPIYLDIICEMLQKADIEQVIRNLKNNLFHENLVKSFFRYLSTDEKEVLQVLSCLDRWNEDFILNSDLLREDLKHSYNIIKKKSYFNQDLKIISLHKVISDQIFLICSVEIRNHVAEVIRRWIKNNNDDFKLFYTSFLRISIYEKTRQEIDELEFDDLCKRGIMMHNSIRFFEQSFLSIYKYMSEDNYSTNLFVKYAYLYIELLISERKSKAAKKICNLMIRTLTNQNDGKVLVLDAFKEYKARILDMEHKYTLALEIREQNLNDCMEYLYDTDFCLACLHNVIDSRTKCGYSLSDVLKDAQTLLNLRKETNDISNYIKAALLVNRIQYEINLFNGKKNNVADSYKQIIEENRDYIDSNPGFALKLYLDIAQIFVDNCEYKFAQIYLEEAIDCYKRVYGNQNNNILCEVRLKQAIVEMELRNYDFAREILTDLKKYNYSDEKSEQVRFIIRVRNEEAILASILGEKAKAIDIIKNTFEKSIETFGYNCITTVNIMISYADLLYKECFFIDSYKLLKQAINISKNIGYEKGKSESKKMLDIIYSNSSAWECIEPNR